MGTEFRYLLANVAEIVVRYKMIERTWLYALLSFSSGIFVQREVTQLHLVINTPSRSGTDLHFNFLHPECNQNPLSLC